MNIKLTNQTQKTTTTPMRIILSDSIKEEYKLFQEEERKLFTSGKLRIGWSQSRGCVAIFVSGRMEGRGFDSEEEAKNYLLDLGINV